MAGVITDDAIWQKVEHFPHLIQADVIVWRFDPVDLHSHSSMFETLLSPHEKIRLDRFISQESRFIFVQCRGVLRLLLARMAKCKLGDVNIKNGNQGKPELIFDKSSQPIYFNISHTRNLCLIALSSRYEVGIDVEKIHRIKQLASLARAYLSLDDMEEWEKGDKKDRQVTFFEYWCAKEAILKALGCGLSIHPSQINLADALVSNPLCGVQEDGSFFEIREYMLKRIPLSNDFKGWLAVLGIVNRIEFFEFTPQLLSSINFSDGRKLE